MLNNLGTETEISEELTGLPLRDVSEGTRASSSWRLSNVVSSENKKRFFNLLLETIFKNVANAAICNSYLEREDSLWSVNHSMKEGDSTRWYFVA